jgi:hypothetical protein
MKRLIRAATSMPAEIVDKDQSGQTFEQWLFEREDSSDLDIVQVVDSIGNKVDFDQAPRDAIVISSDYDNYWNEIIVTLDIVW